VLKDESTRRAYDGKAVSPQYTFASRRERKKHTMKRGAWASRSGPGMSAEEENRARERRMAEAVLPPGLIVDQPDSRILITIMTGIRHHRRGGQG